MGFNTKGAMSGAASGASAGSFGGPWGMAIGGVAGGLIGGFSGGDDDEGPNYFNEAGDEYKKYMDQSLASSKAHEAQGRIDLETYLNKSNEFGQPYRAAGASALQSYMGSMGLGGPAARQSALETFHTGPGYQMALNQGLETQRRNAAANGARGSGAEQKALTSYAMNEADKQYGQWQQGLAGLTNMGQQSSENAAQRTYGTGGSLAQLGLGYSNEISNSYSSIAKAMSEAKMAQAQAAAKQSGGGLAALGGMAGSMSSMMG
jgi:hypothetical protein